MKILGVIFDMDGVILDSEKLYVRFWKQAGRECGFPWEERHSLAIRSLARPYAIERLKGFFGESFDYDKVRNRRIELMNAYISEHGIETKPEAEQTLKTLKSRGFKIALATATMEDKARAYLERAGVLRYFDEVVSAHMVGHGKPEPDIYLYACEKLSLKPENCIAVEDSPNGIISAYKAGCVPVMIPDMDEPDEDTIKIVYKVLRSLNELIKLTKEMNNGTDNNNN